jgi:hypothetical protein
MIRRGATVDAPSFESLECDADDDAVGSLLSEALGIPENQTAVPTEQSRTSYSANIKHAYFYLFQKQGIIANKDQLFYRQNEQFMPQAIKDTFPILMGIAPDDLYEKETKLRTARRDLKILQKQLSEALEFSGQLNVRAVGLLSEAQQVGIVSVGAIPDTTEAILEALNAVESWKPAPVPDEDVAHIAAIEDNIDQLRKNRRSVEESLQATIQFTAESNLGMESPIAEALVCELKSLDEELEAVTGERPKMEKLIREITQERDLLNEKYRAKHEELSAAIAANEKIAEMGNRNTAAARIVGRVSLFLETYMPENNLGELEERIAEKVKQLHLLEAETGVDDSAERLASILSIISNQMGVYSKHLETEFCDRPLRLDLNRLSVVIDRSERPILMSNTGGGSNHLAYHLAALLSIHHYSFTHKRPIPSFLMLDQPTQVYFPSEEKYKASKGSVEETERDSDLEKVRSLFGMLYKFCTEECPGFQIIVSEHANMRDEWFQNSLVEQPWTKPPALIPDDWPTL